jgi:hypothetical protein
MEPLAHALEDFSTAGRLALPTDQSERLAAGRRQRRIHQAPEALHAGQRGLALGQSLGRLPQPRRRRPNGWWARARQALALGCAFAIETVWSCSGMLRGVAAHVPEPGEGAAWRTGAWQVEGARRLVSGRGRIVLEFFDPGPKWAVSRRWPVGCVVEATVADVFASNREYTVRFGDCWRWSTTAHHRIPARWSGSLSSDSRNGLAA